MNDKLNYETGDFSKINSGKILFFSFAQRLVLGIASGLIGPLIPIIAKDLDTGLDKIGAAISFAMIAIFIVAIFLNNIIDILGYKTVLIAGVIFICSGALGIFLSQTFIFFIIFYFIYQVGTGVLSITIFSIIGSIHFKEKSAKIMQTSIYFSLGIITAPLLVSLFTGLELNWQFLFLGMLVFQAGLGIFLIVIKIPKIITKQKSIKNFLNIEKKIILNPFFIITGFMILIYSAVMDTFFTWFTSYFESIDVVVSRSSLFLAIYTISMFIGLILKNALIKKINEKHLLMWGILLSLVFMICIFLIKNLVIKNIMLFFYGIGITGNFSFLLIISLDLGAKYSASISTYTHAMAYLGSILFQYTSGYLSEHFSKNSVFYIDMFLLLILFVLSMVIVIKKFKVND